jgi:multidrug efflux pump
MVVLMVLGAAAYFQLGQDEDPPFAFRMPWWFAPSGRARRRSRWRSRSPIGLERTLQEVPEADKIRSYSKPGESLIVFQLKDSSASAADVPNAWYTVRKRVGGHGGNTTGGA